MIAHTFQAHTLPARPAPPLPTEWPVLFLCMRCVCARKMCVGQRVMRHHKPKCALLENVPGLVTLENGDAIRIIMKALSNEGYRVSYHIVDTALLLPQHRKRVYIVAIRQDLCDAGHHQSSGASE